MRRRLAILLAAALVLLSLTGCGVDEPSAAVSEPEETIEPAGPDPNDWDFDAPENHGMDAELLADLHSALTDTEIRSAVTVKEGVIIDEYYKDGYDETSVFAFHSCSKSFTSALIGLALEHGHIGSIDDLMVDYLPQVADYADARKQQITIKHLLTHTSGIEWYEWGGNSASWRPFRAAEDWVDFVLSQSMLAQPGARFAYSTGGSHLLAAVLQSATGMSALDYGQEYIFGPMGMASTAWRADRQGVIDGGNGIAMTSRDAAKFGQLYLDGGMWRGEQILPQEWVELSVKRHIPGADGLAAYGYQWWIRTCGTGNYEVYYAMGAGGQFIFVVPELDMVTVMTSRVQNTYEPRTYFFDYILEAYMGEPE